MTFSGTVNDIASQFQLFIEILKQNPMLSNSVSLNISFSVQNRQMLLIDRATLREASLTDSNAPGPDSNFFLIEEDIYNLFMLQQESAEGATIDAVSVKQPEAWETYDLATIPPDESPYFTPILYSEYSTTRKAQTKRKKAKTGRQKRQTEAFLYESANEIEDHPCLASLSEHYRIEDHLEESVRLEKPCVFGIKYIDDNYFILFYRRSVYEKGTDTTFRHFLCQQPGTLVAYRYFKDLASLRYMFEKQSLKLRHNGSNVLSRAQADQIVEYFTKCW